jgi:hypothetical protein
MGFETVVLHQVAEVIQAERKACFFNGSLFVECDADNAAKVLELLKETTNCNIQQSQAGGEYVYDFVA